MMACGRSSARNNNYSLVLERSYFYVFLSRCQSEKSFPHFESTGSLCFMPVKLFECFWWNPVLITVIAILISFKKSKSRDECCCTICSGVINYVNKINLRPPMFLPCPVWQIAPFSFPSHFHPFPLDQLFPSQVERATHTSSEWFLVSPSPVILQYCFPCSSTTITLNIRCFTVPVNWMVYY